MRLPAALSTAMILLVAGIAWSPDAADARASAGGSRGSRSYSAPAPNRPAQPSVTPPAAHRATPAAPRPSAVSRVVGFVMGGLVASIVLRALGLSGDWGVGLLDVLLLLGAGYLLFAFLRERGAAVEPIVIGNRKPS